MKPTTKQQVLETLTFGERVAEEERDALSDYFVETDQWRKVVSGEVDIVFGNKGAGKSAIYSTLMSREGEMFDRRVLLIAGEKPRGAPVFQGLVAEPPTGENEFVGLWKLYILSLIGDAFRDYGFRDSAAERVCAKLTQEGLLPTAGSSLSTRFRLVVDWVKKYLRPGALETEFRFDAATGVPTGVAGKISFSEPTADERVAGYESIDNLLRLANKSLADNNVSVWVLFDRLDVAFAESRELEANGLRALFKTYLDGLDLDHIQLKIFLRSDIWRSVSEGGFREASHITRHMTLSWNPGSLLHLVVRRLATNDSLMSFYGVESKDVLADADKQREFFDRLVPDKVDVGNNPRSFEWILGRVQDGTKSPAPREVIHLLTEARNEQLAMLQRGEEEPPECEILSRRALREALFPVSRVRLEQTLYAEYPTLKPYISAMEGAKTEHNVRTLAETWEVPEHEAAGIAQQLVEVGFFEPRGTRESPRFWVPFLYRPGLQMVQGSADTIGDV